MLENLGAFFFILPEERHLCKTHEEKIMQEIITLTSIFLFQK